MWRAPVEFDFFAMDHRKHEAGLNSKERSQRSTINDIQKAMSKIDPQLLKTMFSDGGLDRKPMSAMAKISTEGVRRAELSTPASAFLSSFKNQLEMKQAEGRGAPLTIFYNGGIGKFDVCPDKAEKIIKLAEEFKIKGIDSPFNTLSVADVCSSSEEAGEALEGDSFDLPLARRNSLMAFLDKRRERLTTSSPYTLRRPNKAGALKLPLPANCRNRSSNFTSHRS